MHWSEAVKEHLQSLQLEKVTAEFAQRLIPLIDLTSLNADDTEASVAAFLEKARTPYGDVAAVCVYPAFVRMAASTFAASPIKVATVVNFPTGEATLESVLIELNQALENGAQEIDVVFPYHRYLAGEQQYAHHFVAACKEACGQEVTLKVILETGALMDASIIADASLEALTAGADFIKTSTGKIAEGATLEAVGTMLLVVRHAQPKLHKPLGVKVSGGIREWQQAAQYLALADHIMGPDWVSPETFRIGASKLVDDLESRLAVI